MNNFKAEIKIRESWVQVSAVFPFCVGELLDERLDEAQLTFFILLRCGIFVMAKTLS